MRFELCRAAADIALRHPDADAEILGDLGIDRDRNLAVPGIVRRLHHLDIGAANILYGDGASHEEVDIDAAGAGGIYPGGEHKQGPRDIAHTAWADVPGGVRRIASRGFV